MKPDTLSETMGPLLNTHSLIHKKEATDKKKNKRSWTQARIQAEFISSCLSFLSNPQSENGFSSSVAFLIHAVFELLRTVHIFSGSLGIVIQYTPSFKSPPKQPTNGKLPTERRGCESALKYYHPWGKTEDKVIKSHTMLSVPDSDPKCSKQEKAKSQLIGNSAESHNGSRTEVAMMDFFFFKPDSQEFKNVLGCGPMSL